MAIRCFLLMVDLLVFIVILSLRCDQAGNQWAAEQAIDHRPLHDVPRQGL